jgi:hypothetical protein
VRRAAERITAGKNWYACTSPSASTSMSQTIASRSTSGFSEQSPFESFSGSIGMTRRGKYTDVARS